MCFSTSLVELELCNFRLIAEPPKCNADQAL